MALVKFCNPEHNIHRGAQLQIGTLYKYRTIENPELRDDAEGTYDFEIDFPVEIELDRRWANLLFQRVFDFGGASEVPRFPGGMRVSVDRISIVRQTADSVVVADTKVRIQRTALNCLVFCMSHLETDSPSPFENYADRWDIPENRADDFGRRLGSLIYQQTKLLSFGNSFLERHSASTITSLKLMLRHQPVKYLDRRMIVTPDKRPTFEELIQTLSDVAFLKPKTYAREREYRFVYELVDGNQTCYEPTLDHVMVNPNLLTELISN